VTERPPRGPLTARQLACEVLIAWTGPHDFPTRDLERRLPELASPAERRLATELVHGVVRRAATLTALLKPHLQRDWEGLEPELRRLLQLGVYQLVFLSGIPVHAAVNETTELARWLHKPRWLGFLNGLLRSVSRSTTDRDSDQPASLAVPLQAGRYRILERAAIPDPRVDFPGYFAAAFSFPPWLAERWSQRFDRETLLRMGFWFNTPPRLYLRANTLRTSREQLLEALAAQGIAAEAGTAGNSILVDGQCRVRDLPGYETGWFAVQDDSSQQAAELLAPQPGERVLDLCAAPGGKTAHMAALMNNQGTILACDVEVHRLDRVVENCTRLGVDIVRPCLVTRDGAGLPNGPFDRILLDAPCSNTGVLARRPEARWRLEPAELTELAELQTRLLHSAIARLALGGTLVYSTCSIEPDENQEVIEAVLRESPALRQDAAQSHVPGAPADGGYQVRLRNVMTA